jgi:hypothetical protein
MKNTWRIQTLSLLLVLALGAGCAANAPLASQTVHEDPTAAQVEYNLSDLLLSYSRIFSLLTQGEYTNLDTLLKDLKQAHLSSEILELFTRYNELAQQLYQSLQTSETLLNQAEAYLDASQLKPATSTLDQASVLLSGASVTLAEITQANQSIGQLLGIASLATSNTLRQSYNTLEQASQQLQQAIDRLAALRDRLKSLMERDQAQLLATTLSLTASPDHAFVGDTVTLSGSLSAGTTPLPDRRLTLTYGSVSLETVTDSRGSYQAVINIPYDYSSPLAIQAEYTPQAADRGLYQAAASEVIPFEVDYYTSTIDAVLPKELHPGLAVDIQGRLTSTGEPLSRQMDISLGSILLASGSASPDFKISLTPPASLKPGSYQLSISISPSGRYAGASITQDIDLTLLVTSLESDVRGMVMLPGTLSVSGRLSSATPQPPNATVTLRFNGSSYQVPATGSFQADIALPLSLTLFGFRTLNISVQPQDPWLAPATREVSLFIFNPLICGLIVLAIAMVVILGLRQRKHLTPATTIPVGTREPVAPAPSAVSQPPTPMTYPARGIQGEIIKYYLAARQVLQRLSGQEITPASTLREFMQRCLQRLPAATQPFTTLTHLVEKVLYSSLELGKESLRQAAEAARSILHEK